MAQDYGVQQIWMDGDTGEIFGAASYQDLIALLALWQKAKVGPKTGKDFLYRLVGYGGCIWHIDLRYVHSIRYAPINGEWLERWTSE